MGTMGVSPTSWAFPKRSRFAAAGQPEPLFPFVLGAASRSHSCMAVLCITRRARLSQPSELSFISHS
jgi:hypothetical protein